jgi:LDH2 family malate/lactate/ureidoglycolate dehydrogenase
MLQEFGEFRVAANELERFCAGIFGSVGVPERDAELVSRNLVEADLRGSSSHGVMRVPIYVKRIEAGSIRPTSQETVLRETPTSALLDGNHGIGQVISRRAMAMCIEKAKTSGVAFVAVRRSNHFGMALSYSTMALEHDMIGMVFTSPAARLMAPWGGIDPILDNNPISFAIPAGEEFPVVLDMATTVVSRGKIGVAAKKGERIPKDWALTIDGRQTDDPVEAFDGILLPIGGYKGYGLTVISGILAGLLPGAAILASEISDFYRDVSVHQNIGHFFGATRIDLFSPVDVFKAKMDRMIREIRDSRRAPGVDRIFLPGERGYLAALKNSREGILLPETVAQDLNALGEKYGRGHLPIIRGFQNE